MTIQTDSIVDRLNAGDILLMDGGTGSELQRRGADVLKKAEDRLEAWSATANIEAAKIVQEIHQDYLRVGADIIISNNFWTIPSRMARIGLRDKWQDYANAAAENALKARAAVNPNSYVFGGIAPPNLAVWAGNDIPEVHHMGRKAFEKEYIDHSVLLAQAGLDAILAEYVGHIDDCVAVVDACATSQLPVFIGVRHITQHGEMQYGENLADLARKLHGHNVKGVLLMCSNPEAISAGLPILRQAFDGIVGAYPNIGYNPTGPIANNPQLTNQLPSSGPEIFQIGPNTPLRLAEYASEWKNMGAQIIGGCCATGPKHIMEMARVVKTKTY